MQVQHRDWEVESSLSLIRDDGSLAQLNVADEFKMQILDTDWAALYLVVRLPDSRGPGKLKMIQFPDGKYARHMPGAFDNVSYASTADKS